MNIRAQGIKTYSKKMSCNKYDYHEYYSYNRRAEKHRQLIEYYSHNSCGKAKCKKSGIAEKVADVACYIIQ